jgi:hypothetical protein
MKVAAALFFNGTKTNSAETMAVIFCIMGV